MNAPQPALEPAALPVRARLRFRVRTDPPQDVTQVTVGAAAATDVVNHGEWTYATAPALAAGEHEVRVVGAAGSVVAATLTVVSELLASVAGAVESYRVTLEELVVRRAAAASAQDVELVWADRDMAANAVDTAVGERAHATGGSLDDPAVTEVWLLRAADLEDLETQVQAPFVVG